MLPQLFPKKGTSTGTLRSSPPSREIPGSSRREIPLLSRDSEAPERVKEPRSVPARRKLSEFQPRFSRMNSSREPPGWPGPAAIPTFITTASNSRSPPTPRSSRCVVFPFFPRFLPFFPAFPRFFPAFSRRFPAVFPGVSPPPQGGFGFSSGFASQSPNFPFPKPQILEENPRCLQAPGAGSKPGSFGVVGIKLGNFGVRTGQFWGPNWAVLGRTRGFWGGSERILPQRRSRGSFVAASPVWSIKKSGNSEFSPIPPPQTSRGEVLATVFIGKMKNKGVFRRGLNP